MSSCPSCGRGVPTGANFCPACSRSLVGLARPRVPKEGRARSVAYVIACLTLVGMVAVPAVLFSFLLPPVLAQPTTVDSGWVADFMGELNAVRVNEGLAPLQLNQSLSNFAQVRFVDASQHYDILNYGFGRDYAKTFPPGTLVDEQINHVDENMTAREYIGTVGSSPTRSWGELLNGTYHSYGYFVGRADYYRIYSGCNRIAPPPEMANMTAFLDAGGCIYGIAPDYWLVLELGG